MSLPFVFGKCPIMDSQKIMTRSEQKFNRKKRSVPTARMREDRLQARRSR